MTTSTRYKFVKNALGVVFTTSNFPVSNDGDDRQTKTVKRVLAAIDIGNGAGKVGHADGCIVDVIPNGYNVLWIEGRTYRPLTALGDGSIPYVQLDNDFIIDDYARISYRLGVDNTIVVTDKAYGTNGALVAGDIVTVKVVIGAPIDSSDSMN